MLLSRHEQERLLIHVAVGPDLRDVRGALDPFVALVSPSIPA